MSSSGLTEAPEGTKKQISWGERRIKPAGTASLTYKNKIFELPAFSGTEGPDVVDIRKLYGDADIFTYDPGFTSTASCESNITFIHRDKHVLLYRGYPLD